MESNFLTTVFLPLALFVIMLGMGLELTWQDFRRIAIEPKGIMVGLAAQLLLLPLIGLALAKIFNLPPPLAVGVMVIAACPGGPTSNIISYLIKGNVALSVTLTALSSLITIFTIPLVINFSTNIFLEQGQRLQLPFLQTILQIAVITLIPVSLGMAIHHFCPALAATLDKYVKWLSLFFLTIIIVGLLVKEKNNLASFFLQAGGVTLCLNLITMALGFALARLAKLDNASTKSITIEVGLQNGTLAIAIASGPTFLNSPTMAIPAAMYSLIMFATGAGFGWLTGRLKI